VVHYPHCVPIAGALEYTAANGVVVTLALVQAFVANQGDGWSYTLAYLERFLEPLRTAAETVPPDVHGAYLALVQTLGLRTAELHVALARRPATPRSIPSRWGRPTSPRCASVPSPKPRQASTLLQARVDQLADAVRDEARALLQRDRDVRSRIAALARRPGGAEDPLPRRLPPRPGAGHAQRLRHHRLRRRAGAQLRGAAREGSALRDVAPRHAAFVQLRALGVHCAGWRTAATSSTS
jgi:hypothetical protein